MALSAFNFNRWIEEHAHLLKPRVGNQLVFREAQDLADLRPLFAAFCGGTRKCPRCGHIHPGKA